MTDIWDEVKKEDRAAIEKLIGEIRDHQQADTLFALEKGAEITKWSSVIKHGEFLDTLAVEANLQPRKAQRWMKAAKAFEGNFKEAAKLSRQAVYDLSGNGDWLTEVRDNVIREVEMDHVPSAAEVRKRCTTARSKNGVKKPSKATSKTDDQKSKDQRGTIINEARTLYVLLREKRELVSKIIKGENWDQVREELLKLLKNAAE